MYSSNKNFKPLAAQSASQVSCFNPMHLSSDLLPVLDIISIFSAVFLSVSIYDFWQTLQTVPVFSGSHLWQAALVAAILAPFFLYDKHFGANATRITTGKLLRSHLLRFMLYVGFVLVLESLSSVAGSPALVLLLWAIIGLTLTSLSRLLMTYIVRRFQRGGQLIQTIAIVGAGRVADRLVHQLLQSHSKTTEFLGIFDDKIINAPQTTGKPVGNIDDLIELSKTRKIDWILLALPPTADKRMSEIVERLKDLSIPIGLCPEHVGLTIPYKNVDFVGDTVHVSRLVDRPIKRWNAVIKTIEDLVLGIPITLCALPVMAIIALAIKIDSRGPILYKQKRHTLNNKEFDIYKFRSMRYNPNPSAQKLVQTSRDDDRITRVGRFLRASSLDEIPQLFNVLKGDMSLVGPRPHAVNMRTEERLGNEITSTYAHRHRVKPGLTGWSQVNGARGATDNSAQLYRRVRLDLEYIENWSVMLDLKILAMTFGVVIKMTNAY